MSVLVPAFLVCDNRRCRLGEGGQPKQDAVLLLRRATVEGTWLDTPYSGSWCIVTAGVHACGESCRGEILGDTPTMQGGRRP